MDNIKIKSSDLFSKPSFSKGVSRILDLFGNLDQYDYRDDADAHAIKKDWENVGSDLKSSIEKYGATQTRQASIKENY